MLKKLGIKPGKAGGGNAGNVRGDEEEEGAPAEDPKEGGGRDGGKQPDDGGRDGGTATPDRPKN